MKKTIILLILVLSFIGFIKPVMAQDASASLIQDLKSQIDSKQQEIQKLEEQAAAYKKELENAQSQTSTLKNQIATIDSRIKKIQNDISITTAKIDSTSLKIEELSLNIMEKQNDIDKKKDSIASMIQVLYEYDQTSLMEMVLTKSTFSELLDQVHYLETIQGDVYKDMLAYQELKRGLEDNKAETEAQRNDLYSLRNQLSGQKQIVNDEKQEKNYLLTTTKGQEKQYQSLLNQTLRQQQEIEQQIYDLEDKIKRAYNPSALPEARPGVLSWPLDGILTQGYGYTPYSKKMYAAGFHNGIDISSSYGEPIRAAADGVILAIGNCGKYAYGKWIMIKHDNGLSTLYGHMSNYGAYKTGERVNRGDIIGYEGSTGYSTGAHVHFGVYASETVEIQKVWYGMLPIGAHQDPMKYL